MRRRRSRRVTARPRFRTVRPGSPMLQEPFTALCTPIRSPAADGALLRLHLPAWIFRTSANDSTCPPPGIPLRIVRTSAGPRLDFSEAVRPGPFGHWRCSIGRMNWPMRRAPDALRGRLLRHVRQPLPASFFPDVLHDIASRAARSCHRETFPSGRCMTDPVCSARQSRHPETPSTHVDASSPSPKLLRPAVRHPRSTARRMSSDRFAHRRAKLPN